MIPSSNRRASYRTPVLRDHGTVAEMTLAGNTPENFDGAGYDASTNPTS